MNTGIIADTPQDDRNWPLPVYCAAQHDVWVRLNAGMEKYDGDSCLIRIKRLSSIVVRSQNGGFAKYF